MSDAVMDWRRGQRHYYLKKSHGAYLPKGPEQLEDLIGSILRQTEEQALGPKTFSRRPTL